jgi:hypothetical protein
MRDSKNTMALRAQYPELRAWVLGNLTQAQLEAVCQAPRDCVLFDGQHPLNNERFAAGVFRAYRREAIWWLTSKFTSVGHFDEMRGQGSTWDALYHHALITAIAFMADEDPALLAGLSADRHQQASPTA